MNPKPSEKKFNCKPFVLKLLTSLCLTFTFYTAICQNEDSTLSLQQLKNMSLEELMNIRVTSVSKHPEKLENAASAIQVITQKEIKASGVKTLAEALRLASNLQVAQVNASQWAISARGFDNVLSNKLLVLIDGRIVYTPLYAGVFWDVQNLLLDDIDRIEVISGPGGTLWGANAVNGVINIITKKAADTKGLLAEVASGSNLPVLAGLRYGGNIRPGLSYRVYGTGFKIGNTLDTNDVKSNDAWHMIQGGFRVDWDDSKNNRLSLQSNAYQGKPNPDAGDTAVLASGENVVAGWNHKISDRANFQIDAYYDHTWRNFGNGFTEDLRTWDLNAQHRIEFSHRNAFTYGLELRALKHSVTNLPLFAFLPGNKSLYYYSGFVQDQILIKDMLHLTIGTKIEHNSYTNFEYQPSARLAWNLNMKHTIWTAVSRAVRTPARIDRDFYLYLAPNFPFISGNNDFTSEDLVAYEAGWRSTILKNVSFSLAAFFNVYDNIRSAEPGPPPFNLPVTFGNGVKGNTKGFELSFNYQPVSWWSLRGGYTFLKKNLKLKEGSHDANGGTAESDDPSNQVLLQSITEIGNRLELGVVFRYVDKLPKPYVPSYADVDVHATWKISSFLELSITGQNLFHKQHIEFIPSSPSPRQIPRSVYAKIICQL
jgi:iron complex outermembrane receptor protein